MIRRSFRFGIRLGLLAGIAFALFKFMQGRRSASEFGRPAQEWAPPPKPAPSNLPRTPPEPELVQPVILEEVVAKKTVARPVPPESEPAPPPDTAARADQAPAPNVDVTVEPVVKKVSPAKRAAKKQAADPAAAAAPVKKAAVKKAAVKKAAAKKAAAKKAAAKKAAPAKKAVAKKEPGANKAAPVKKKATKKQPPQA